LDADEVNFDNLIREATSSLGIVVNYNLLYRASRDGWDSKNNYHPKVDGKINTITLLKVKTNGYIIGGFHTVPIQLN
jgi:hypothetical protein